MWTSKYNHYPPIDTPVETKCLPHRYRGMRFYLKKSTEETHLIMLEISDTQFHKGKFRYSTRERIIPSFWEKGKVKKTKDGKFDHIQARLDEIKSKVSKFMTLNRATLTRASLKNELDSSRPKEVVVNKQTSVLDEWQDYIASIRGSVAATTMFNYERSYALFEEFLGGRNLKNLTPSEFSLRIYQSYFTWLKSVVRTDSEGNESRYRANTVATRVKGLVVFLNYLKKMRVTVDFDLSEIKAPQKPGVKINLTQGELAKLEALELTGELSDARYIFLLQCNTGMRVSDLFRLDQNLKGDRIVIETKKVVGNVVEIPITSKVRQILERYNYKLPIFSKLEYWKKIKVIYKMINPEGTIQIRVGDSFENKFVWEEISSHDAVRTFITISAERGMPIPAIAKIVGKTVDILLKNYLVPSQKTAEKAFLDAWER